MRAHAQLAAATLGAVALIAPIALRGQAVDHHLSPPPNAVSEVIGRAGVSALILPRGPIPPIMSIAGSELVQRDTSGHHRSRAHHAAVGALIGGTVGLVLGIAGDRPGLGRGEMQDGHFHNLWLVTVPVGAGIGALIGMVPRAD